MWFKSPGPEPAFNRFGGYYMIRNRHIICLLILIIGLAIILASEAAAADELEIFAGQDKTGRVNVPLSFNDAQIIKPDPPNPERQYIFSWDFDAEVDSDLKGGKTDDGQSYDRYTEWTYFKEGKYLVTLTVDDGVNTATSTLFATIKENAAPEIFANESESVFRDVEHLFYAEASDDNAQAHLLRWHWEFGDGEFSDDPPPVAHTFSATRVYNVKIRVIDPENKAAEHTILVSVTEKPGEANTLYPVNDGRISQKGKEIREDSYISYKLEIRSNHDVEVKVTVGSSSPPVGVLVFDNEDAWRDYEVGVGGTWNGDLSKESPDYEHKMSWRAEEDEDVYIVIDNGYKTGGGFGNLGGMATVDVSITDTDHGKWYVDIPSFLWYAIIAVVILVAGFFLVMRIMEMQTSRKQQVQAMQQTVVQKDQATRSLASFLSNPEGVTVDESERAKHMVRAPPPGAPPMAAAGPGAPPGARPGGPPPGARPTGPPPGARPGGPGGPPPRPSAGPPGPPPGRGPPPGPAPEEPPALATAPEAPAPSLVDAPQPEAEFAAPEIVESKGPVYLSTEQPKRVTGFGFDDMDSVNEEPFVTEPEADVSEAVEPEADVSEAVEPEADEPEAGGSETEEPEADEPEADEPEAEEVEDKEEE
jgi:PKD repeat protein